MHRSLIAFASVALFLAGCPSDPVTPGTDSGPSGVDAPTAETDTGVPETDTGVPETDTGVPDIDGGGGDVDAGGTTGGACTNAADATALPMSFMGMTIEGHTSACAMMCITATNRTMCINDCIQSPTRVNGAISSECTNCFAAAAACTIMSCLTQCIGGATSPACVMCQCTNCAPAYTTCSGIPDSRCTPTP